ncbi:hypothetical protein BHE74_00024003 [Ensete ventricosum]|nr:hypothetical protein BHE74_00024003 [Ensete ventricosum]
MLFLLSSRFETLLYKLEVLDHKARERAGVITTTFGAPIPVLLSLDAVAEVNDSHFWTLFSYSYGVAGTWTSRYRAVPPKINRRRIAGGPPKINCRRSISTVGDRLKGEIYRRQSIEGEIDRRRSLEREKKEEEEEEEEKKKKRKEERRIPSARAQSSPARRCRPRAVLARAPLYSLCLYDSQFCSQYITIGKQSKHLTLVHILMHVLLVFYSEDSGKNLFCVTCRCKGGKTAFSPLKNLDRYNPYLSHNLEQF